MTRVKDVDMLAFTKRQYHQYGTAVLEDRAIPDYRDGMNPVNRRALWASHELGVHSTAKHVKAARVVGDTLGKYHPHGDTACYDAIVKMANTNSVVPLIDGDGNWGSLSEPGYAAMRYTECRLSKFSDKALFNKFYLPVVDMAPNYDSQGKEPVLLPALLPIVLLNGRFGIAPGAITSIPSFALPSVLNLLKAVYSGEPLTPKLLYKTLKFVTVYGGREREIDSEDAEAKAARMAVFKDKAGSVRLWSNAKLDGKEVVVTRFAPSSTIEKMLLKLLAIDGVATAKDASGVEDKYGKIIITFKRGLDEKKVKAIVKQVNKCLSISDRYVLNFTERYKDDEGQIQAKTLSMSLCDMLAAWIKWRTELEVKACEFWIKEDDKEIRRLDLLAQAVDLIDFIVSLLRDDKLETDQVYEAYSKKAKVTIEEAKYVLGRPIISLRKLEKSTLMDQKKQVETNRNGLKKRKDKPQAYMATQLNDFAPKETA